MTRLRLIRVDAGERSASGERLRRDMRSRFHSTDEATNLTDIAKRRRPDPHQGRTSPDELLGVVSSNGRVRRDLHAERQTKSTGSRPAMRHQSTAPAATKRPPLVVVEEPAFLVLAIPDLEGQRLTAGDRDMIAAAHILADESGGAVVVLASATTPDLDMAGADRVLSVDFPPVYAPDNAVFMVVAAIRALAPRHVLFCENTSKGGDLGRRVAAELGEMPATHVVGLTSSEVRSRGWNGRLDALMRPPRLLIVEEQVAAPNLSQRREARLIATQLLPRSDAPVIVEEERFRVDPDTLPIVDADFIVSGGNGVADWAAFQEVAAVLGATRGGSRIVCDQGHLPRNRQVGASGTLVRPRCYLAFGIAGAPQHLQGIRDCERVIAVNTDLHADMVKRADLSIIADAQAVIPALIELIARRRAGKQT